MTDVNITAVNIASINTTATNSASINTVSSNIGSVITAVGSIDSITIIGDDLSNNYGHITDNGSILDIVEVTAGTSVLHTVATNIAEILLADTNAGIATAKANEASTSASTAATKAAEATVSANSAGVSAGTATTKASESAASATSATLSASTAVTKAGEASASAISALASLTAVNQVFDNFDDVYLGSKATDPTLDNDGNALVSGSVYWNSTASEVRFYNGTAWERPEYTATQSALNAHNSETAAALSASLASNKADSILDMTASATQVSSVTPASVTYDNLTGVMEFEIPQGEKGVTGLVPEIEFSLVGGDLVYNTVGFIEGSEQVEWSLV